MNYADAANYNTSAAGRLWRGEQLPSRFQRILGVLAQRQGNGCHGRLPTLLDGARAALSSGQVTSAEVALFAQEVALFQRLHGLVPDGKLGPATFREMHGLQFAADPRVPFRGKGLWIWNESQLPKGHVEMAVEAGIRHVLIKVADHGAVYPVALSSADARATLQRLFAAYRRAGIVPVPWVYAGCYEQDSEANPTRLLREVRLHVELVRELEAPAIVVNAEKGFRSSYSSGGRTVRLPHYREHAARYMEELRRAAVPIALSSYFYATARNFAWRELVERSDILMPQVYWSLKGRAKNDPHRAVHDATETWDAHAARVGRGRPMCPSGALYQTKNSKGWPAHWHRPEDIDVMVRMMGELLVPACTFWWFTAPSDTKSSGSRVTQDRWDALKNAAWSEG